MWSANDMFAMADPITSNFLKSVSSADFTWSIRKYFDTYNYYNNKNHFYFKATQKKNFERYD